MGTNPWRESLNNEKSHHTTTLHQFTLLSKRGVRLHLKNQTTSSRNHLKNPFWKEFSAKLHWKNRKKLTTTIILHETELQLLFSRRVQTCLDMFRPVLTCPDLTTKLSSVKPCL